jgi:hypothetical protein
MINIFVMNNDDNKQNDIIIVQLKNEFDENILQILMLYILELILLKKEDQIELYDYLNNYRNEQATLMMKNQLEEVLKKDQLMQILNVLYNVELV